MKFFTNLLVIFLFLYPCSSAVIQGLKGPSKIAFTDDNGTVVTFDFSDIEFFPADDFNPFYSPKITSENSSDPSTSTTPTNMKEYTIVLHLIDSFKFDSVDEEKPRVITNAKYIVPLRERFPLDELSRYQVTFNGVKTARDRKFNNYQIEKFFGYFRERQILASINVQRRAQLGRKVIRFAFVQSYNRGSKLPKTIWLTDGVMWKKSPFRHVGQAHTLQGWAFMWTEP